METPIRIAVIILAFMLFFIFMMNIWKIDVALGSMLSSSNPLHATVVMYGDERNAIDQYHINLISAIIINILLFMLVVILSCKKLN